MSCGKKNISFWGQRRIVPLPAEVHKIQQLGVHSDLFIEKIKTLMMMMMMMMMMNE